MKSPCIKIWKVSDAPKHLQLLYHGLEKPEWVALVPREIDGKDLQDVMGRNGGAASISRYSTPSGDMVYIGAPRVNHLV